MTLPSGRDVSIVDVPGHVRFVRHMLAGVGAIDLALLVVAADEGVMPQTREHLEILDLLELQHGVVALTKLDLVDEEWAELVEEELREQLAETSLAGAPIVRTSVVSKAGLDELRTTLDDALAETPEPRDLGRPRFGIDRVFTMAGFGTVVTGTLLDGRLRVGDAVEAVPDGPEARIRGLQTHQQELAEALPGTRVAVNLAGVGTDELQRGQVLAPPGELAPATTIGRACARAAAPRPEAQPAGDRPPRRRRDAGAAARARWRRGARRRRGLVSDPARARPRDGARRAVRAARLRPDAGRRARAAGQRRDATAVPTPA